MKKAVNCLAGLTAALTAGYPAGTLAAMCFGYELKLFSIDAYAVLTAVLTLCAAIAAGKLPDSRAAKILLPLSAPVCVADAGLCVFQSCSLLTAGCFVICFVCLVFVTARYARSLAIRCTALILSAVLVCPVCFVGFMSLVFGSIGENTVVLSLDSPGGKYCAQLISSDRGALGGASMVEVRQGKGFDAGLFRMEKKPKNLYTGPWDEREAMEIAWKNDRCLLINNREYEMEW